MIEFDKKFFEGEERDGFYVEGEMKRAWAAQMEVLMEIDRICKKYGITYFADSGTLLGAVRHNGFVPWDDDIDIAMLRSDYMRFLSVVSKELEPSLFCSDVYRDERWTQPFARIVNGVGITLDAKFLDRYHDCPYGVGVDIFVLDNLPASEDEFHTIIGLFSWIWNVKLSIEKREKEEKNENSELNSVKGEEQLEAEMDMEDLLSQIEKECKVTINREKNIRNQLLRITDGLFAMYNDDESTMVANMAYSARMDYSRVGKKKEWYREVIELPFENITIPVPIDYNQVLEKAYGVNYLTPTRQWSFHNYPFYKNQRKTLQEVKKDVRNINEKMDRLEELLGEV